MSIKNDEEPDKYALHNEYFRLMNQVFHDTAQAHAFLKGGTLDDIVLFREEQENVLPQIVGGTFIIQEAPEVWRMEYFLIRPDLQGKGLGEKYFKQVERDHPGFIYLFTSGAHKYWLSQGFKEIGYQNGKYLMGKLTSEQPSPE